MSSKATLAVLMLAAGSVCAQDRPLRDPMQPYQPGAAGAGAPGSTLPRYELTAVLISASRRIAVLNGRPYQRGDRVDGAEITRIEPQAVHLREDGADLVVHLQGDSGS